RRRSARPVAEHCPRADRADAETLAGRARDSARARGRRQAPPHGAQGDRRPARRMSKPATPRSRAQRIFGPLPIAIFFSGAGVLHFTRPEMYEQIMPPQLPAHRELVLLSGAAEIAGGVLYLLPRTRRFGALYLIALLAAVFPS